MFGNDYVTRIAINVLRSFDACYHAELQDMWYKAHYKEAEKIRARPLGEKKFLADFCTICIKTFTM